MKSAKAQILKEYKLKHFDIVIKNLTSIYYSFQGLFFLYTLSLFAICGCHVRLPAIYSSVLFSYVTQNYRKQNGSLLVLDFDHVPLTFGGKLEVTNQK